MGYCHLVTNCATAQFVVQKTIKSFAQQVCLYFKLKKWYFVTKIVMTEKELF